MEWAVRQWGCRRCRCRRPPHSPTPSLLNLGFLDLSQLVFIAQCFRNKVFAVFAGGFGGDSGGCSGGSQFEIVYRIEYNDSFFLFGE